MEVVFIFSLQPGTNSTMAQYQSTNRGIWEKEEDKNLLSALAPELWVYMSLQPLETMIFPEDVKSWCMETGRKIISWMDYSLKAFFSPKS